jgi:hypothetical protein
VLGDFSQLCLIVFVKDFFDFLHERHGEVLRLKPDSTQLFE